MANSEHEAGQDPLSNLAGAILEQSKDRTDNVTSEDLVEAINEEGIDGVPTLYYPY
jgi:hypothetical protein